MKNIFVIISIIFLFIIGCSNKAEETGKHFIKSMEYNEQANKILNKSPAFSTMSIEELEKIIDFRRKALHEAKQVNIDELNKIYNTWGDHYRDEFIMGIKLIIEGHEANEQQKSLKGQILHSIFEKWYEDNLYNIKGVGDK